VAASRIAHLINQWRFWIWNCQDLREGLGDQLMEWPFFSHCLNGTETVLPTNSPFTTPLPSLFLSIIEWRRIEALKFRTVMKSNLVQIRMLFRLSVPNHFPLFETPWKSSHHVHTYIIIHIPSHRHVVSFFKTSNLCTILKYRIRINYRFSEFLSLLLLSAANFLEV